MRRFRLVDIRTPWLWLVVFYRKQYGEPLVELSIFRERTPRWWFHAFQWESEPSRTGQSEMSLESWSEEGERLSCSLGHPLT